MKNIYGITIKELEDYFTEKKEGKYKATQVFEWLYKKRISSFSEMRKIVGFDNYNPSEFSRTQARRHDRP